MITEKKVENDIKKYLKEKYAFFIKVHGSGTQPAGTPDILACVSGKFVGIEVKRPDGGRVSTLQRVKIKQIQQAGGIAFVARSVEQVKNEFDKHNI